jgi:predicted dehydrogenase
MSYRAAVIGLSGIGAAPGPAEHAELGSPWPHSHVASYGVLPNVELVAVCDLKPELLDQFRAHHGSTWPNAHAYADYRELLERDRVVLLNVVTSDHRHAQMVVDAAEAGVKGILCEKPLATTLADADRMIEACARRGVVLSVNHTRRWRPEWHAGLAQLGDGGLGAVRRIVGHVGSPRAMLFRNGTHLLDTVCWFAGGEPDWVVGVLDEEHSSYGPRYAGDGGRDPALDPGGSALVHFKNGLRAFVNCSKRMHAPFNVDVFCELGQLRLYDGSGEVWAPSTPGGSQLAGRPLAVPLTRRAETPAAVADVIHAVEHGGDTLSPAREARKALAIIIAILQSSAAGGAPVRFPVQDA